MIAAKTNGVYPAPKAIMSCVYEGLQLPFDAALRVETRYFVSLLRNPVAKSMIRTLFFGLQEANKLARRPKGVPKQEYKKIGVLGAGLMGSGIATVAAQAGLEIVLIDRDQASADKGKAHIAGELDKLVKRGRLDPGQARRDCWPGERHAGLRRAQGLPARGRGGVREPRGQGRGDQEGRGRRCPPMRCSPPTPRPCRSPAWPRPRRGRIISSACISSRRSRRCRWSRSSSARRPRPRRWPRAMDFVQKIRKTPIVVNDSRGFFTSPRLRRLHQRRPSHAEGGHPARR